ncbi:hypothetical protein BKA61DRAFT_658339 [Leptodontidium sp. MPI-SDFR-AT-0119]|nr:hypothetical protein BKA61DRAFT_658339 [Leptodontidium sp. MPI-SDFR-AT-0119]
MPQHPSDESPSVLHNNQLNTTDFMDFGAYCPLDGTEWIALGSNDNMELSLCTGAQDYHGHTESQDIGLQHDSIGGEPTYSRSEAGLIPNNISASCEMEIDGPINDQDNTTNRFQNPLFSEASRQYITTDGRIAPASSMSVGSKEDVVNFDRAHLDPVTIGIELPQTDYSIMPAIPQHSIGSPHRTLSNPNHGQRVSASSFTGFGHENPQSFEVPGAVPTYAYGLPEAQDPELNSSWNLFDSHPDQSMEINSSSFNPVSEPWYSNRTANWLNPTGAHAHETLTGQNQWTLSIHPQPLTSQPLFTNSQPPGMIAAAYEDFPSSSWVGVNIARTNSPENMATMYHDGFSSVQRNVPSIDSHIPAHDINLNRLHQGDANMRPTGVVPPTAKFPSRKQSNGRPSVAKRRASEKGPTRTQTEDRKKASYEVRSNGGACEHCRLIKKVGSVSVPCYWCRKIIGKRLHLALAICYKRNFWQVFGMYSDFHGTAERGNSIKSEIETMHGKEYYLFLGCGLRENLSEISIDIDPSNVCRVKIQRTTSTLWQHTISTHDSNLTTGMVALTETSRQASYAIVPDSLPDIDSLDAWGRQDIGELARKWPSSLAAAYDLALLEYLEHYKLEPQLLCFKIVQDTMRIVSLGKNLDSRRPINHNKIVEEIKNLSSSQFGIKEFNECKIRFQLSRAARTQLYLHAARGIEETQRSLGEKLDQLFDQNGKGITRDDILLVGACLHRLCLEYRQRLQRYREFAAGTVDDRIERCLYMYTFFTRLYELWYRGRAKGVFPMSSGWNTEELSQSLRENKNLVDALSKLSVLEQEFCKARLNDPNEDDSIYKSLIIDRALGKSCHDAKVRKAHTWPSHSTKQPSAVSSYITKRKVKSW